MAQITEETRRRRLVLMCAAQFRTKAEGRRWAAYAADQLATLPDRERGEIMSALAMIGELEEIEAKRDILREAPAVFNWLTDSYKVYRLQLAEEKMREGKL